MTVTGRRAAAAAVLAAAVLGFGAATQFWAVGPLLILFGVEAWIVAGPALIALVDARGEAAGLCFAWGILGAAGAVAAGLVRKVGTRITVPDLQWAATLYVALPCAVLLAMVVARLGDRRAVRN